MNQTQNLNIFKNLIFYTFILLIVFLIYKIQFIVLLFFAAFIVASSIDPMITFLSRKIPRKLAVVAVAVLGLILIAVFLVPFINILVVQTLSLLKNIPEYWEKFTVMASKVKLLGLRGFLESLGLGKWIIYVQDMGILPDVSQMLSFASGLGQNILSGSIDSIKNIISSIMFVFLLAMLTLYMLIDKEYLSNKIFSFFPQEKRERAVGIMLVISKKVGGYVISQIIVITFICLFLSLGLFLIKVEFALILGFVAALLELVPFVGPLTAAVLIFLVTLAQKPILAVFALIVYGVVEWIVDNIARPVIFSRFLSMHPLTFIFSLYVGATLFGIAGVILAPAFAAVVCVLIDELYLNKINPQEMK